ncbi:PadR family transcriptional regulator PadR [Arthrobacter silviterrae]|nr:MULTISPECIES: PadR family transcriptional regulator [Arthrobacter]MCU6482699.1 PadR family transcriptional regulator [Arthrobacter sp. A2-55]MDQ0277770.1 PadR family transcriptional regulator PadR [Arthrobacter silviterrae]
MGADGQVLANLRKGVLQYCVLALMRDADYYGHDLARKLAQSGLMGGTGTIYPLLARLRRNGLVDTTWKESTSGPPRRYYRLTKSGKSALAEFTAEWDLLKKTVDVTMNGTLK